jgi:hypothetical protein
MQENDNGKADSGCYSQMKVLIWSELQNGEQWYCCAICDSEDKPTGLVCKSDDYQFLVNHAEYYARGLGLNMEDKVCQSTM